MMLLCSVALAADPAPVAPSYGTSNEHTITITNTDQHVSHTYTAYQVFVGNLDDKEMALSDILWGNDVDGAALLAALKASTDPELKVTAADIAVTDPAFKKLMTGLTAGTSNIFANCATAADVAQVLSKFTSTGQKYDSTTGKALTGDANNGTMDAAGRIDAVATIIAETTGVLTGTGVAFTENNKTYTADVTGDGYYIIKDTTTNLNNTTDGTSDTKSKYLLSVVKDVTVVAKDTGLNPDKKILDAVNGTATETKVAADSSAIGDTVKFQVTVEVPNTKKYEEHFWFVMKDKLPAGITFTGITSVKIGDKTLKDITKEATAPVMTDADYDGATGYYTLALAANAATAPADKDGYTVPTATSGSYPFEAATYDAVKEEGGQYIRVTFNQFKKFVETNNLIGQTVTIEYTGVVNDDAEYQGTANENEVFFQYSNNPNHDYDGDNPGPDDDEVTGVTPKDKTRTYTTSLKVKKVDENQQALAGAEFELKGTSLNRTVLTGYKFELTSYTPTNGEVVDATATYWKLKDGSYTTTDPATVQNTTQYASTTDKYYKVTYTFDEVTTATTDIKLTTDADGFAEFVGLREGDDYTLEEIHSPDGYNKLDGKATFKIEWTDPTATTKPTGMSEDDWATAQKTGGFYLTVTADTTDPDAYGIEWNETDKQFEVTIMNQSGAVLPSTGGIGTTIFYIAGSVLVLAAAILLITKRRMSSND